MKRLEERRALRGVDKKTGATELNYMCARGTEASIQVGGAEVSTVGVITDVTNIPVVRKTTYATVAFQACSELSPAPSGVDVKMGGTGDGPTGSPPVPVILTVEPMLVVVRAQPLLVHCIGCRCKVGAVFAAARSLTVGECTVHVGRWLLVLGRCWRMRLSSVVVDLYCPVVVLGYSV